MEIIIPKLGLFFWATLIFLTFFFILRKYAWGPIIAALKEREDSIQNSLDEAKKARAAMTQLKADNEALLREARIERDSILRTANEAREKIIADARAEAAEVRARDLEKARQQIEAEKMRALTELKNQAGLISVQIAEKILREKFNDRSAQEAYAKKLINEMNYN